MENEKKNKTSPIPHANDNGDRLTNLQYFLRLASSSSLGRSKAASALSLYFFFASSENASAKIYRVVSFFPEKK